MLSKKNILLIIHLDYSNFNILVLISDMHWVMLVMSQIRLLQILKMFSARWTVKLLDTKQRIDRLRNILKGVIIMQRFFIYFGT